MHLGARQRIWFWLTVAGLTLFMTVEPALFLVVLAIALSGLAVLWAVIVAEHLLVDVVFAKWRPAAAQDEPRNARPQG